jgi:hypothetical protein
VSDTLQWDYSCSADILSAWIAMPQPCDEVAVDDSIVIRISRAVAPLNDPKSRSEHGH